MSICVQDYKQILVKMMQNPLLGYKPLGHFLGSPMLLMAGGGSSSSGSESGSPSPPVTPGKSFTIDAILGLHPTPSVAAPATALDYSSRTNSGIASTFFVLSDRL